jgi:hypothetical protein
MYREAPDNPDDSGWRFFAGDESQEYLDNSRNLEIENVNTIANYDPEITHYSTSRLVQFGLVTKLACSFKIELFRSNESSVLFEIIDAVFVKLDDSRQSIHRLRHPAQNLLHALKPLLDSLKPRESGAVLGGHQLYRLS